MTLHVVSTRELLMALGRTPPLPAAVMIVLERLSQRRGYPVSKAELTDALWGGNPEGAPLDPIGVIYTYICRLRRAGVPIVTLARGRWTLGASNGVDVAIFQTALRYAPAS